MLHSHVYARRAGEWPSHTCLLDSMRAVGLGVPYNSRGPHRAVAYGSRILGPLGFPDMIVHFETIYAELCMFLI